MSVLGLSVDQINEQIAQIASVPNYLVDRPDLVTRLNHLEAELIRRNPAQPQGKSFSNSYRVAS